MFHVDSVMYVNKRKIKSLDELNVNMIILSERMREEKKKKKKFPQLIMTECRDNVFRGDENSYLKWYLKHRSRL